MRGKVVIRDPIRLDVNVESGAKIYHIDLVHMITNSSGEIDLHKIPLCSLTESGGVNVKTIYTYTYSQSTIILRNMKTMSRKILTSVYGTSFDGNVTTMLYINSLPPAIISKKPLPETIVVSLIADVTSVVNSSPDSPNAIITVLDPDHVTVHLVDKDDYLGMLNEVNGYSQYPVPTTNDYLLMYQLMMSPYFVSFNSSMNFGGLGSRRLASKVVWLRYKLTRYVL